jgi:hypothetical protein
MTSAALASKAGSLLAVWRRRHGWLSRRVCGADPVDNPRFELLAPRGLTAPMQAVESSQSMLAETLPPQTHRIDTAPLARADRPQRKPTAEIENDARPAAVFTASTATVGASS